MPTLDDAVRYDPVSGHFRLGPVLRLSWAVYLRHFLFFNVMTLLAVLPTGISESFLLAPSGIVFWSQYGLTFALNIVLISLASATIYNLSCMSLEERASITDALSVAIRNLPAVTATIFLMVLGFYLGLVLLVIPALVFISRYFSAAAASSVERLGPIAAMKRSAALTAGFRWKLLQLQLILLILQIGPRLTLNHQELMDAFHGIRHAPAGITDLKFLTGMVIDALTFGFSSVVGGISYTQLCHLKDGQTMRQFSRIFD